MYLKRIEIHGFKSFADKINVSFEKGITGIVGPNGCGKSNISDAVRWVLGEQSVKSLRGSTMSDVIFAGSQDRKAQSVAEVTLVFDNHDKHMEIAYDEVEITRRLYRQNSEAEYLLNKQPCRLKDIVDLIMDTGLGKDSLSMISQGNISSFADSKPDERRAIFEEAAGVAKYKKRKIEAIRKLERTTENLERVKDIVQELEKQIKPLKRQKDKADQYLLLKKQLTDVEVNVLVYEIKGAKEALVQLNQQIKLLDEDKLTIDNNILLKERQNDELKQKMFQLDNEVNHLQTKLYEVMNEVSNLETTKVEVDQKRKYLIENSDSSDLSLKIEQLKNQLSDALAEYNDRVQRFKDSTQEIDELIKQQNESKKDLENHKTVQDSMLSALHKVASKKELIEESISSKANLHQGVKAILENSKNNPGILGIVEELILPKTDFERAIATALGGANQNIVTNDENIARNAIRFLKENRAGRATFIPITTIKTKSIKQEHQLVCLEMDGYLGSGIEFVRYNDRLSNVVKALLGNVIIVDTLENASKISNATLATYKVVTLDGDIVNVGGSMTGGANVRLQSLGHQKNQLNEIKEQIENLEKSIADSKNKSIDLENLNLEINHSLLQKQMAHAQLEVVVARKKERLLSLKGEYESLAHQQVEFDDLTSGKVNNELIINLNDAIKRRDDLTQEIKSKRELRMIYVHENEEIDKYLKSQRAILKEINNDLTNHTISATRYESTLSTHLNRLNESYKMTYDYALEKYEEIENLVDAKQIVATLRYEIEQLGNVNLDAIEQYEEVSTRFETMSTQRLDLLQAQQAILDAIEQMDKIMVEKFSETFDKINIEFNQVFRSLFGGGSAQIKYSDPDNILETGVDIDIQPPGKAVQNISLFSGGEKALIAISCLFAILKVRPVPMCILDEVEAALDIANVDRFAKYLKEFSQTTQFIVVTHREGMMAQCDTLYGATMQQKGVTKLVGVKFEEGLNMSQQS